METVDDILREMREECNEGYAVRNAKLYFADRIEAAYAELLKKIQKLESALKPVLDIVMDSATSDLSMELAITEAQRIYNEDKQEAK